MFCKTFSAAVSGINGVLVTVEADVRNGLPCFQMVGGVIGEAKEAKERVKIALENSGFILPPKHITVNMSPAEIKKEGTAFDLAVAAAILAAFGYISEQDLDEYLILGELSLDGKVKKVKSLLPLIFVAKKHGLKVICPKENIPDLGWSDGVPVLGVENIEELAEMLMQNKELHDLHPVSDYNFSFNDEKNNFSFNGIYGNDKAKRALIIAASGGHSVFMSGTASNEKKKLAEATLKLLPKLTYNEAVEVLKIRSVMGIGTDRNVDRPFISIDGSDLGKAMKLCLSHNGILWVNDLNSVKNGIVSSLFDHLGDKYLKTGDEETVMPWDTELIVSGTLCPCGAYPDKERCSCTIRQRIKYLSQAEGLLADRTDIMVHVTEPCFGSMLKRTSEEDNVAERISDARKRQYRRFGRERLNASMTDEETEKLCALSFEACKKIRSVICEDFPISGYYKVLRIARSIADYEDSGDILPEYMEEAYSYVWKG